MIDRANVVRLETEAKRNSRVRLARLPAPVHEVHEKGKQLLAVRLKQLFDKADDSLFELADKAQSNQEQNIFFDSMREVRVQRRGIEKRFGEAIDEAFAQLTNAQGSARDVYEGELSADALSLVQNDDLDEMVALDSCIGRANREFFEAISQLSLRLDCLLPVKVYHRNNPLGPEILSTIFMAQTKRLDIDIKAKLVLFKLFDKIVISDLANLYTAVNRVLIEHSVLPSLRPEGKNATSSASDSARDSSGGATAGARKATGASAPSAPVAGEQASDAQTSLRSDAETSELAGILKNLVGEQAFDQHQPASSAGNLLSLLSLAQHMPVTAHTSATGVDIPGVLNALQQQNNIQLTLGRVDEEVINLVNMLFQFILEDRNLALPMKTLISRMQIPVVKVALMDKTFFTKKGHAARRLLNEFAGAGLGWQGKQEGDKADPLYAKMEQIVDRLLAEFDADVALFPELLAEFTSFLQKDARRAAVLERRTLDAEDGKARAEVARNTVALEIELRTQGTVLPTAVSRMIDNAWRNVLFVTGLKHGFESEEWQSALQTLTELIWSVGRPDSADDRRKLIQLVPTLLKKLRQGMEVISYNPFDMSELFKALEEVHLARIRGKALPGDVTEAAPAAPPAPQAKNPVAAPSARVGDNKSERPTEAAERAAPGTPVDASRSSESPTDYHRIDALVDAVVDQPTGAAQSGEPATELAENDPHIQQVMAFSQGSWFEMHEEGKAPLRCRLAAFIKPTGKYIFVNRSGMKAAEKTRQELAWALKRGELRPLDNSMLFERALETVVTSLRKPPR